MKLLIKLLIAGGAISAPAFTVTMTALSNALGTVTTLAYISPGGGGGGGVITPSVSAARTSGVAPLYVNIDATGTTSTLSTNASHELYFATDFGDPSAGTWANGVQSTGLTSKNLGIGPVTGHVYETPGTYTVTTVITDGVNTEERTNTITVQDPNVVYAGALTICISHSGNFTGAPSGATQVNTAGNTDMYAAMNGIADKNNKRILFCKADAWTCSAQNTFANITGMTISGYGAGVARSVKFGTTSDTLVDVTAAVFATDGSVFNFNDGNSDIRIHNFKIAGNMNAKASGLNNSLSKILFSKIEIRGALGGFTAYPGGGGTNNVFDQHCLYECLADEHYFGGGGFSFFVGLVRGGIMGCYIDQCNAGEGALRIPFIDRGHINNNYIARPNKTKNIVKIHSFDYTQVALYSEKFVFSANVMDLRGGYSYNGTTVTEVGESSIIIGSGGVGGGERVRNGIVENNYTYGCRGNPKRLVFASINCPNMTIRNNIADFLLGSTSAEYFGTFSDRGATFCTVGTSTSDPTIGVRIYNNTMYCNMDNSTSPMVWITGATTSQVEIKNNISYQPYLGFWADKIVYVSIGATTAAYTASNNTVNQNTDPVFVNTPPVALTDWRTTAAWTIDNGATVPVLRDFNQASRYGTTYDLGAVLP